MKKQKNKKIKIKGKNTENIAEKKEKKMAEK